MTYGVRAAIFWAAETLLLNQAMAAGYLAGISAIQAALLAAALHDCLSAGYLLLYLSRNQQIRTLGKAICSPGGRNVMLAALLGGTGGHVLLSAGDSAFRRFHCYFGICCVSCHRSRIGVPVSKRTPAWISACRIISLCRRNGNSGNPGRRASQCVRLSVCGIVCHQLGFRGSHQLRWNGEKPYVW